MGRQSHDLSRSRARAGGVGPCRCRGRSCPAGSDAALAAAAICRSGPGRDPEPRQSAADEDAVDGQLLLLCSKREKIASMPAIFVKLVGNEFCGLCRPVREEGTDLRCRHDIRQAVRPSIPGGLRVSGSLQATCALSCLLHGAVRISPSTPRPADAETVRRAALPRHPHRQSLPPNSRCTIQRCIKGFRARPGPAALREGANDFWRPRQSRRRGRAAAQRR